MGKRQNDENEARRRLEATARAENGCWQWEGAGAADGYGCMRVHGKRELTHRLAYRLYNGPIPAGLCVLHRCDNRRCCNPEHLFLGTRADNMADMWAKGRQAKPEQCRSFGNGRLLPHQIHDIRRRYAAGETQYEIADVFGVSQPAISKVVRGETWQHI